MLRVAGFLKPSWSCHFNARGTEMIMLKINFIDKKEDSFIEKCS
jgi:hypothetical protein